MSKRPAESDKIEPDEKQARLEVSETVVTGTEVSESEVTLESSVTDNVEVVTEDTKGDIDVSQVEEVPVGSTVITDENGIQYTVAKIEPEDEKLGVEEDGAAENVEEPVVEYDGQEVPEGSTVLTDEDGLQYTITEIETGDDKMGGGDGPVETVIDAGFAQNIIVQHMDISEPLQSLRKLLENRLQCSLADHDFFLQDSLQLDPNRNLVEQCVQGEGMVQINVEVISHPGSKPKINIVDILKPAEEIVEVPSEPEPAPTKVVIPEETEHITRWIVDQNFRKEQERLKIPFDPSLWNESHVKHWIQWATKEFSLVGVNPDNFNFLGKRLCEMQYPEFSKLIPCDRGDVFWTHLELLRKCKFVATIQPSTPVPITTVTVSTSGYQAGKIRTPRILGQHGTPGNRTGNNGQIQLWQFLLDLLTDRDCREIISWCGDNGEFKLNNPEMVARLWGQRKNKPTMNYEKLSRALRYYYDGDMISKVHGKRFVYKYVCDLRCLLGYSAAELNQLVNESADKKLQKVRETLRPGIIRKVPVEKTPQATYMMVEKVVTPEVSRTEVVNSVTSIQIASSTDEISTS